MTSKYVFFYGWKVTASRPISLACFSQWYGDAIFTDDELPGKTFKTAEHYMMYHKALLFDRDAADAILNAPTPDEAKKRGRQVRNFDREIWDKYADDIVERANWFKFDKNEAVRGYLFDTQGKILVEASKTDRIWGVGFSPEEALEHESEWGTNR